MEIKPRPVKKDRQEEKSKQVKVSDNKKEDTNKESVKKETDDFKNLEKKPSEACGSKPLDHGINPQNEVLEDSYEVNSQKCIPQETVIYNVRLARAYVPFQKFCTTYVPLESLKRGTIFPELDL